MVNQHYGKWPLLVYCPCLLVLTQHSLFGALQPLLNPDSITMLLPFHMAGRHDINPKLTPLETILALQQSTLLIMIAMLTVGVMVYGNRKVVRAYVVCSALADLPHWASFLYVLGGEGFIKWRTWSGSLWMQMTFPIFTFLIKLGYLMGSFGHYDESGRRQKRA